MSARPGLCGGRSAMIVPTAIANQRRGPTCCLALFPLERREKAK